MELASLKVNLVDETSLSSATESLSIGDLTSEAFHDRCAKMLPQIAVNDSLKVDSMDKLLLRLSAAELRVSNLYFSREVDPLDRVKKDLATKKVYSSVFLNVAPDYYEKSLLERAKLLNCTTPQLCKSIIFENTAWVQENNCESGDPTNSRFYLVLVQYEAKFDAELLRDLVHSLRAPDSRLPRKRFHFQLASQDVSNALGGFDHNAVSPFGLLTELPIVICRRCLDVRPPYVFMGGGKVDVKLGISVSDFLRSTNAIVGKVSVRRIPLAVGEIDDL